MRDDIKQSHTEYCSIIPSLGEQEGGLEAFKLKIVNSLGQLLREEVLRQAQHPNEKDISIKTDELPNGIYLPNLKSAKSESASKRFVISR